MEALSDIPLPGEIAPDSAPEPTTTITNNEPEKVSETEVGDSSVSAEPSEEPVATTDTDSNEVIDQKSTDDQEKTEVHESIESEQTEPMDVDTNTLNAENLNELEVPTVETSAENETPMDTSDVNKESSDVNTEKEAEIIEAETTIQETIDESENEPKPDDALKQSEKETENESDVAPEEVTDKEPVVTENSIDANDKSESSEPPKEPETEMDTDKTNTANEAEKETQEKESEQVKKPTTSTENENTESSEKQSESTSDKNTSEAGTSMDITNEISKDTADISKDLNEDSHEDDEGTEFVQVNTENEPNESEKDDSNKQDEFLEDPIGADELDHDQEPEHETETMGEGADEELCIIPDTERVISQAEKDAASSIPPLKEISATSASESTETSETAPTPEVSTKIVISKCTSEEQQTCMKCQAQKKAKYSLTKDGTDQYLCDDACLEEIKEANAGNVVLNWDGEIRVKDLGPNKEKEPIVEVVTFIRKCAACSQKISNEETNLTWEIMDFCNEMCLSKYQKEYGSRCSSCSGEVRANSLGKYCVRFGNDIRQFCTSHCLEEYKKGLKVCSYCQQDMSTGQEGFLAPVGDKGQFKDFCSQLCMEKYDIMTNDRPPKVPEGTTCSVCKADKAITIDFTLEDKSNFFCSEPCFVAFRFVNSVKAGKCAMCRRYFPSDVLEGNTMFYDNVQHSFCSNSCQNIYIIAHRKIVPCSWCKVKKYNFDMIRRYNKDGTLLNMCSVNCLSLYQVSMNAVNSKKTSCDFCLKNLQAMYHLTMSDATIRNFCSYNCVMSFQNKFAKQPITLNSNSDADAYPIPTGGPKRSKRLSKLPENASTNRLIGESPVSEMPTIPIISSVQSLANTNGTLSTTNATRQTRAKAAATPTASPAAPIDIPVQLKQHIIVKPTPVPEQRNVMTMCRVKMANKGSNAVPKMVDASVQTDKREADKILIPVPVPIFIPVPLHMFTAPVPTPVPFPIPVPVPIFIPTTRNSANGILKEIKKIQVKIPTDPYEAELLMMAEMVAGDKKEDHTDSESDLDDTGAADDGPPAGGFSPDPQDASNTFGDDMLQMALKMATELEEPAVDLEGALTANTITAAAQANEPNNVHHEESVDDPQMLERTGQRGRKRGMRGSRSGGYPSKRGRRSTSAQQPQLDIPMMGGHQQPPPPPEPVEKPDANMCLKYTFGVNAWKQWVTFKNAELEKSSRRVKLFKTEILQLTSDELNYSLCLFVKEVRKPNGAEYAPDTIYYLCLGIQQYLFENGRIDNIFCDTYYEKFTDCLDEVARKFSVLYNDSHYIVTRVEEEHLWESKQLGAHSPHVLLSTLMFFNTKHFNLTTVDEHMQLSFSHIMKHWKRNPNQPGAAKVPGSRNVLLRFYPPQSAIQNNARKKKVYEQQENEENPLRCPVKLYEFYLSKCPESVKTRNDVFYLQPERSCVPDSPVWYSTMPLPREALEKMLHRVKMVKEINVALLTS